ncbi:MAG: hypothetical protein MJ152_01970 [Clostridia bacterium]|nr:hypothetical protein [Clostridia bacterium]
MKDICDKIYNRPTSEILMYFHKFFRDMYENRYVDATTSQNMIRVMLEYVLRTNNIDTTYVPVKIVYTNNFSKKGVKLDHNATMQPHTKDTREMIYDCKHNNMQQDHKRFAHKQKQKFADEFETYATPNPNKLQASKKLWFEVNLNKESLKCDFAKTDDTLEIHKALSNYINFLVTICHEFQHIVQQIYISNKIDFYGNYNNTYNFDLLMQDLCKYNDRFYAQKELGKSFYDMSDALDFKFDSETLVDDGSKENKKYVVHKMKLINKMIDYMKSCHPNEVEADEQAIYNVVEIIKTVASIDNVINKDKNERFIYFLEIAVEFLLEEKDFRKQGYYVVKKDLNKYFKQLQSKHEIDEVDQIIKDELNTYY